MFTPAVSLAVELREEQQKQACAVCVEHNVDMKHSPFSRPTQDQNRYHEDIFGVTLRTYEVTNRIRSESIAYIEENKKDSDE